jgi:putative oxidoreductase
MFANLLKHPVDVAAIILRVGLATVFIFHGYLKIVVGNQASSELVSGMSPDTMLAVGWAELICAVVVALGLFTRVAALALIVLQMAAIAVVTGSLMPHVVRHEPGKADYISIGVEFNMALIAMCLSLFVLGAGLFSLDHLMAKKWWGRGTAVGGQALPAGS